MPGQDIEFAAVFLVLQTLNYRSKPMLIKGDEWRHAGLDRTMAYGIAGTERFQAVNPQLPPMARRLQALDTSRITAHHGRVEDLDVIPGSVLYLDPPYLGTTGYADELSRDSVEATVSRWAAAGCRVGVSEGEVLPGMRGVYIGTTGKSSSLDRTNGGRQEWLSLSFDATQLHLLAEVSR